MPALASELTEALDAMGMEAALDDGRLLADGTTIALPLLERAHPHPGEVAELVSAADGPALIVADRLSEGARQVLRDAGWSWLDRRGHIRVWVPGLRIDTPIGLGGDLARGTSTSPWTPVGFEVALHALIHPDEEVSARRIARDTGRSPGGTQEILARFVSEGLVGRSSRLPLLPDLFWETSARWPDDGWTRLGVPLSEVVHLAAPSVPVRVDERAATLGGARIAAAGDLPARCYLDRAGLRRVRPAAAAKGDDVHTWVRTAPVRWLPELEGFEPDPDHPWRVAHPVLCAIRLAGEGARGREIVEDWGVVPGEPS